jgi:hypothetical protein
VNLSLDGKLILKLVSEEWFMPITMALQSAVICSYTEILVSNSTVGRDVYLRFSAFVLSCVSIGFVMDRSPVQGVLPNMYKEDSENRRVGNLVAHWPVMPKEEEEEEEEKKKKKMKKKKKKKKKKNCVNSWIVSSDSVYGTHEGICENGNEPSGSIINTEFLSCPS